jgi:hypothetical protein
MRFVTYITPDGDRAGVLSGEQIHALPPGLPLLDLIADADRLRAAGEEALRSPSAVHEVDTVRLRAPIPHPPTIRDFMTF